MSQAAALKYSARYTIAGENGGYQIRFYCAMCDYYYTTGWISAGSETEARRLTEKEAKRQFNGCRKCGRWVCDEHYNMGEMMCLGCAPTKKCEQEDKTNGK